MELYDSFSDDSSIYSKFYSKEIFLSDKCYKFSSLIQSRKLGFDVFLHEMNKFCKKKHCFAKRMFVFKIYFYKSFINM